MDIILQSDYDSKIYASAVPTCQLSLDIQSQFPHSLPQVGLLTPILISRAGSLVEPFVHRVV